MTTFDKTYTIKYSKSGIYQYSDFKFIDDKLAYHSFHPSYVNINDVPKFTESDNIYDILKKVKEFSYGNRAEIYKINGYSPKYFKDKNKIDDTISNLQIKFDDYLNQIIIEYYKKSILPILKKKRWKHSYSWVCVPILVILKNDEYINIDYQSEDYRYIDFLCHKFLSDILQVYIEIDDYSENGYYMSKNFSTFMKYIPDEYLNEINILIKPARD